MFKPKFLLLSLLTFFIQSTAIAALSPVSIAIVPPLQFPPGDFSVTGARASILWGNHRDMYGLDLGLIGNVTQQDFVGVGLSGIFNITRGTTSAIGLQVAGLINYNANKTSVYGLQLGGLLNVNEATATVVGIQAALLANLAEHTTVYGVQIGLYNRAIAVYGLQIGLINVVDNLHGVQIGLLNFNHKGTFAVAPILNVGF